jgi:hypothetical protein
MRRTGVDVEKGSGVEKGVGSRKRGRESLTRICNEILPPIDDIVTVVDVFGRIVDQKRFDCSGTPEKLE